MSDRAKERGESRPPPPVPGRLYSHSDFEKVIKFLQDNSLARSAPEPAESPEPPARVEKK